MIDFGLWLLGSPFYALNSLIINNFAHFDDNYDHHHYDGEVLAPFPRHWILKIGQWREFRSPCLQPFVFVCIFIHANFHLIFSIPIFIHTNFSSHSSIHINFLSTFLCISCVFSYSFQFKNDKYTVSLSRSCILILWRRNCYILVRYHPRNTNVFL